MTIEEIMNKYTTGEMSLEETNKALAEAGANVHLDPMKNILTAEEMVHGTAGFLDTGTGTMDKVAVKDGHLVNCDMGESYALCFVSGKMYHVHGTELVEE